MGEPLNRSKSRAQHHQRGYVFVELRRLAALYERIKALAAAGSADAKSLAEDAESLVLEAWPK